MKLNEIAERLKCELEGDGTIDISGVATLESAQTGQLSFLTNAKYHNEAKSSSASAIIVDADCPPMGMALLRSGNPYLAFAAMLAAGLEGVEKEYPCPEPVEENVFEMSEAEQHRRGIEHLPGSLWEAIELAEGSELLRRCLGDHLFDSLITNKKIEWSNYRRQVTDYELKRYLPTL